MGQLSKNFQNEKMLIQGDVKNLVPIKCFIKDRDGNVISLNEKVGLNLKKCNDGNDSSFTFFSSLFSLYWFSSAFEIILVWWKPVIWALLGWEREIAVTRSLNIYLFFQIANTVIERKTSFKHNQPYLNATAHCILLKNPIWISDQGWSKWVEFYRSRH